MTEDLLAEKAWARRRCGEEMRKWGKKRVEAQREWEGAGKEMGFQVHWREQVLGNPWGATQVLWILEKGVAESVAAEETAKGEKGPGWTLKNL